MEEEREDAIPGTAEAPAPQYGHVMDPTRTIERERAGVCRAVLPLSLVAAARLCLTGLGDVESAPRAPNIYFCRTRTEGPTDQSPPGAIEASTRNFLATVSSYTHRPVAEIQDGKGAYVVGNETLGKCHSVIR